MDTLAEYRLITSEDGTHLFDDQQRALLVVLPLGEPSEVRHVELVPPTGAQSHARVSTPLLLSDGVMVLSWKGAIFAVQTAVPGLAGGPFPRGAKLGGNQNRGYVGR